MWQYTEKTMDFFNNPRNCGTMENADGIGNVGNLVCGDSMQLFLKIADDKKTIADAKFQTFGCASAIASASALTCMIIGKTIEEAIKLTNQDIVDFLGGLPDEKEHCSVMGYEALQAALLDMKTRRPDIPLPAKLKEDDSKVICHCFNVTENKIRSVVKEHHLTTLDEVMNYTKAGGACGRCRGDIQKILDEINGGCTCAACQAAATPAKMTTLQKISLIQKIFTEEIIPGLQADGGSAELVDVNGNDVQVRLQGHCATCPSAKQTLKHWVEATLRHKVDPSLNVVQVE